MLKVADFGLSEDIYARNYFRQTSLQDSEGEASVKLPVRWMALESLHDGIFTEKTDVVGKSATYFLSLFHLRPYFILKVNSLGPKTFIKQCYVFRISHLLNSIHMMKHEDGLIFVCA